MQPSDVSIGLQEIVCLFDELEDPRSTINRLHPLPSVLTHRKEVRGSQKGSQKKEKEVSTTHLEMKI